MKRTIAFVGISTLILAAFVAGLMIGGTIRESADRQISELRSPAGQVMGLEDLQAHADSALDEIRTLYQGMTVLASWYGSESGNTTANGERYDPARFTAAHRTLPFGTLLVVENVSNGRMATVRVNDRGPARRLYLRQIDLSYGVAQELGMVEQGIAVVRVWVIWKPTREMVMGRLSEGD